MNTLEQERKLIDLTTRRVYQTRRARRPPKFGASRTPVVTDEQSSGPLMSRAFTPAGLARARPVDNFQY